MISHDTAEARGIADYIGLLHKGNLVTFGEKDVILRSSNPAIAQFFGRSTEGPISVT